MAEWIKKAKWGKILISGIVYTIIAFIIRQLEAVITMKYYLMPQYFGLWSKIMMPNASPPPADFFLISLVFTFVSGVSLAIVYSYLRNILPKDFWKRSLFFADLMIGTSFIFFTLPSFLMFNVPLALLISWFVSSFIILVVTSFVFVKLIN
jgi:hypothetical protein